MMKYLVIIASFAAVLMAHDLHHRVTEANAVVVSFAFNSDEDFSYKPYEVYAPAQKIPYAVGRTDKHSRVLFMPDTKGKWLVKVVGEDGHGASVSVTVDHLGSISDASSSLYERFTKMFVGVAIILAVFGFISLRRKGEK